MSSHVNELEKGRDYLKLKNKAWKEKCTFLENERKDKNRKLNHKYEELSKNLESCKVKVGINQEKVDSYTMWGKKKDEETANLKIMNKQLKDKEEFVKKPVVKVMKEKAVLFRNTVEKKNA